MSIAGNTTVIGGGSDIGVDEFAHPSSSSNGKKISFAETAGLKTRSISFGTTDKDYFSEDHPLVVQIGKDGVVDALRKLNDRLVAEVSCKPSL